MMMAAVIAEEGHEERTEDVEGGHGGGEDADPEDERPILVGRFENRILTIVARRERESGDREARAEENAAGYGNLFREAAHLPEVLFAGEGVDDAAGAEEEQSLEEGVRHHVE